MNDNKPKLPFIPVVLPREKWIIYERFLTLAEATYLQEMAQGHTGMVAFNALRVVNDKRAKDNPSNAVMLKQNYFEKILLSFGSKKNRRGDVEIGGFRLPNDKKWVNYITRNCPKGVYTEMEMLTVARTSYAPWYDSGVQGMALSLQQIESERLSEIEAKRKAKAERKAEEEAKRKAEAEARKKADEEAKLKAEAEAQKSAMKEKWKDILTALHVSMLQELATGDGTIRIHDIMGSLGWKRPKIHQILAELGKAGVIEYKKRSSRILWSQNQFETFLNFADGLGIGKLPAAAEAVRAKLIRSGADPVQAKVAAEKATVIHVRKSIVTKAIDSTETRLSQANSALQDATAKKEALLKELRIAEAAEKKAAEEKEAAKKAAEEEAKKKAEEVKRKAEAEARKRAEEEAKRKAEAEARKKAEEAKRKVENDSKKIELSEDSKKTPKTESSNDQFKQDYVDVVRALWRKSTKHWDWDRSTLYFSIKFIFNATGLPIDRINAVRKKLAENAIVFARNNGYEVNPHALNNEYEFLQNEMMRTAKIIRLGQYTVRVHVPDGWYVKQGPLNDENLTLDMEIVPSHSPKQNKSQTPESLFW